MTARIHKIVNFYGRTSWHVSIGPHFLGAFSTEAEAKASAERAEQSWTKR